MTKDMQPIQGYHNLVRSDVLHLVPKSTKRVLDVGGGVGANAHYLKQHTACTSYVLIDMVADHLAPEVDKAYTGDLENPELMSKVGREEGLFDAILFLDILEHLRDPWQLVRSCVELLSPGGVMIVSLPNVRHTSVTLPLLFGGRFDLADKGIMDRTHLRWFTRSTAIDMFTPPGMEKDHVEARIYQRSRRLLNKIAFGSLEGHLAQQYFIRTKKVG